jgi:hypothetical protein
MPDSIEESQKAQLPKIRPHGLGGPAATKTDTWSVFLRPGKLVRLFL